MITQKIEWFEIEKNELPKEKTGILLVLVAQVNGQVVNCYYNTLEKKFIKDISNTNIEFKYKITYWAYRPEHPIENQFLKWVENEIGKENMI